MEESPAPDEKPRVAPAVPPRSRVAPTRAPEPPPPPPGAYGLFGSLTYKGRHRAKRSHLTPLLAACIAVIFLLGTLVGIAIAPSRTGPAALGRSVQELAARTESLEDGIVALGERVDANVQRIAELKRQLGGAVQDDASRQDPGAGATEDAGDADATLIAEFTGTGSQSTPAFEADEPWRIRWQGRDVFFFILRSNGELVHGDGGSGTGEYLVSETGSFSLNIVAQGRWSIRLTRA